MERTGMIDAARRHAQMHDVVAECMREAAERQLREALESGDLSEVAELSRSIARAQAAMRAAQQADREARLEHSV